MLALYDPVSFNKLLEKSPVEGVVAEAAVIAQDVPAVVVHLTDIARLARREFPSNFRLSSYLRTHLYQ